MAYCASIKTMGVSLRILRAALVGALTLTATAVVGPAPVFAAGPPVAPYDALILDSPTQSSVLTPQNAIFSVSEWDELPLTINANTGASGVQSSAWRIWRSTGSPLAVGTYTTKPTQDATHPAVDVWGSSCDGDGTLVIHELAYSSGKLTTLAADYSEPSTSSCTGGVRSQIRWHSSLGYTGSSLDTQDFNFGRVAINSTPVPQTVTLTSSGSLPTTVASVAVGPWETEFFTVTQDTCTGATLAYGESCTVTVTPVTSALGERRTYLNITDSNGGQKHVNISGLVVHPQNVQFDQYYVDFGQLEVGTQSVTKTVTVTSTGPGPLTTGATTFGPVTAGDPLVFTLVSDDCANRVMPMGTTCTVKVKVKPTEATTQQAAWTLVNSGFSGTIGATFSVTGYDTPALYYPVTPARLLDTRIGLGVPQRPIPAKGVVRLQVTERGGVPAGISAVVLNVTVTGPTATSYLTVYPAKVPERPLASSLNFTKGWTGANSVTVKVSKEGQVEFYNNAGQVDVIADVVGYYAGATTFTAAHPGGGQYHPVTSNRVFDSREGPDKAPLDARGTVNLGLDFGAVNSHVKAVAVNITAVLPTKSGFLSAWNGLGATPSTSTLNFTAGKIVPNHAIVPVSACDFGPECAGMVQIGIFNGSQGPVDVLVDVVGYYDDNTVAGGLRFKPRTPIRLLDSREMYMGDRVGPLAGGTTIGVIPRSRISLSDYTKALALNVTAVAPTKSTFLTLWRDGLTQPTVSTLNPAAGQTVPNAAIIEIGGPTLGLKVYNRAGYVDVLIDVLGTFEPWSPPSPGFAAAAPSSGTGTAVPGPTLVASRRR